MKEYMPPERSFENEKKDSENAPNLPDGQLTKKQIEAALNGFDFIGKAISKRGLIGAILQVVLYIIFLAIVINGCEQSDKFIDMITFQNFNFNCFVGALIGLHIFDGINETIRLHIITRNQAHESPNKLN